MPRGTPQRYPAAVRELQKTNALGLMREQAGGSAGQAGSVPGAPVPWRETLHAFIPQANPRTATRRTPGLPRPIPGKVPPLPARCTHRHTHTYIYTYTRFAALNASKASKSPPPPPSSSCQHLPPGPQHCTALHCAAPVDQKPHPPPFEHERPHTQPAVSQLLPVHPHPQAQTQAQTHIRARISTSAGPGRKKGPRAAFRFASSLAAARNSIRREGVIKNQPHPKGPLSVALCPSALLGKMGAPATPGAGGGGVVRCVAYGTNQSNLQPAAPQNAEAPLKLLSSWLLILLLLLIAMKAGKKQTHTRAHTHTHTHATLLPHRGRTRAALSKLTAVTDHTSSVRPPQHNKNKNKNRAKVSRKSKNKTRRLPSGLYRLPNAGKAPRRRRRRRPHRDLPLRSLSCPVRPAHTHTVPSKARSLPPSQGGEGGYPHIPVGRPEPVIRCVCVCVCVCAEGLFLCRVGRSVGRQLGPAAARSPPQRPERPNPDRRGTKDCTAGQ
ncbi:hypothetical protein PLESTM_001585100 [Pleodorina starrii]|nr:hypothetical protein PLESTM_001585100 [Pleodorina starrii]